MRRSPAAIRVATETVRTRWLSKRARSRSDVQRSSRVLTAGATTTVTLAMEDGVEAPRVARVPFPYNYPMGEPGDRARHREVALAAAESRCVDGEHDRAVAVLGCLLLMFSFEPAPDPLQAPVATPTFDGAEAARPGGADHPLRLRQPEPP